MTNFLELTEFNKISGLGVEVTYYTRQNNNEYIKKLKNWGDFGEFVYIVTYYNNDFEHYNEPQMVYKVNNKLYFINGLKYRDKTFYLLRVEDVFLMYNHTKNDIIEKFECDNKAPNKVGTATQKKINELVKYADERFEYIYTNLENYKNEKQNSIDIFNKIEGFKFDNSRNKGYVKRNGIIMNVEILENGKIYTTFDIDISEDRRNIDIINTFYKLSDNKY